MVLFMCIGISLGTNLVWEYHLMQAVCSDRPYNEITSVD